MPAVVRFSRMPRMPFFAMASSAASVVFASITATPRARAPSCLTASSVQLLSVPYTLGCTMTTRSMCSASWSARSSCTVAVSGV